MSLRTQRLNATLRLTHPVRRLALCTLTSPCTLNSRFMPEATRKTATTVVRKYNQAGALVVRPRSDNPELMVLTMLQPNQGGELVVLNLPIVHNAATGQFGFVRKGSASGKHYGSLVALIEYCKTDGALTAIDPGGRGLPMHALVDVFASAGARRQTLQVSSPCNAEGHGEALSVCAIFRLVLSVTCLGLYPCRPFFVKEAQFARRSCNPGSCSPFNFCLPSCDKWWSPPKRTESQLPLTTPEFLPFTHS